MYLGRPKGKEQSQTNPYKKLISNAYSLSESSKDTSNDKTLSQNKHLPFRNRDITPLYRSVWFVGAKELSTEISRIVSDAHMAWKCLLADCLF